MNYRHAYHAGNFADVVKHAVLCRALVHLQQKPAAFRVLDTHAGSGIYDLAGIEAGKTGEWRNGIGRLLGDDARPLPEQARVLLAPYLDAVAALNPSGKLTVYPGSPAIVRAALRRQDRLIACELEPKAAAALAACLRGDPRAKALTIDGWTALAAYVPPKERRGLVLMDPPYEAQEDEFRPILKALREGLERWPTGTYALWYPIKRGRSLQPFLRKAALLPCKSALRIELLVRPDDSALRLNGSGMLVINPPWKLDEDLAPALPVLARLLGEHDPAWRLEWLKKEEA
jgi:23S rRNA (adenine2030-N6)-methyltransferase